jgi:hypothetical protein
MEYGAELVDLYFRAASEQDSEGHGALRCTILRAGKFDLTVNLKSAKAPLEPAVGFMAL